MSYPIRVVIAGLPTLQADLVHHTLSTESDLTVVASVGDPRAMAPTLRVQPADVVIVWARSPRYVEASLDLLTQYPRLCLLLLADDGDAIIEARIRTIPAQSWREDLIAAVRGARMARPGA